MGVVQVLEVLNTTANGTTYDATTDIVIGSGSNRAVGIFIAASHGVTGGSVSFLSLTLEGVTVPITETPDANGRCWCGFGVLKNPASGASTVSVTFSTTMRACLIVVVELDDIDQTTPTGAQSSGILGGTVENFVVPGLTTTVANSIVFHWGAQVGDGTPVTTTGATEVYEGAVLASSVSSSDISAALAWETAGSVGAHDCTFTFGRTDRVNRAAIEFIPASGGGAQTITGSDHADSDSFGSGSISVGAVSITGTLFSDGDTFGAGVAAPGPVTVTGALHADPDSFFAGAISVGPVGITGGAHSDPEAFGAGTVSQGGAPAQGITGSGHIDPDSFGSGSVAVGAVAIVGTLHADPDSFGSGSVQPGSVTLTGTIYVDPDQIGSGIVSQGGPPPQNLGGSSFADADAFGAGTIQPGPVSIGGGQYIDIDTFGAGLVSAGGIQITGLSFADPDSFGSGGIQPGPVVLAGTLFVDPDAFGAGTVTGGLLGKAVAIHLNGRTTSTLAGSRITSTLVDSRTP